MYISHKLSFKFQLNSPWLVEVLSDSTELNWSPFRRDSTGRVTAATAAARNGCDSALLAFPPGALRQRSAALRASRIHARSQDHAIILNLMYSLSTPKTTAVKMPCFVLPAIVIIKRMICYINDFMLLNYDNESLVVRVADPLRPFDWLTADLVPPVMT